MWFARLQALPQALRMGFTFEAGTRAFGVVSAILGAGRILSQESAGVASK